MNEMRVESTTLRHLHTTAAAEFCKWSSAPGLSTNYCGVPAAVYEALRDAPSKGGYFNRVIRKRFPCVLCASAQTGLTGKD
jgi:hypothetical protein